MPKAAAPSSAPAMPDIFGLVEAAQSKAERDNPDKIARSIAADCELLFVGSKQCGKTTLIQSFLLKDEVPKPTAALEYRFARRQATSHAGNTVANIWELGGGSQLAELVKSVLLPERIGYTVVAVTLDIGSPADALSVLLFWLEEVRKQVDQVLQQLERTPEGRERAEAVRAKAAAVWEDHPDRDQVRPIGIPVLVIAHKGDAFDASFGEAEYRKLLSRTLRHFCHENAASLIFTSNKEKSTLSMLRNILYHFAFGHSAPHTIQLEHSRPIVALAGSDAFEKIGKPPLVEGSVAESVGARWQAAFAATFPPKKAEKAQDLDLVEAEQFAEEAIDELRLQKREALISLRKQKEADDWMQRGLAVKGDARKGGGASAAEEI